MADPFSVAGSAVGVVALGLEVCKGLAWYIGHVKDEKQEVSQIADRLDKLANILEKLKTTLDELEPTADGSTLLSNAGLLACSSALNNIQLKLQPSIGGAQIQGFRQSVRYWKSKLAYPFRREDLLFLKQMVEDVQQNLHTTLLALLLDQQRVNHMSTTNQLSNLSQSIHLGSSAIEHRVAAMQPEITDILALARPMAMEIPHVSTTLSAIASSVKELETRLSDMSLTGVMPRSVGQDIQQFRGLQRRIHSKRLSTLSPNTSLCHCRLRNQKKTIYDRSEYSHGFYSILYEHKQTREHDSSCWLGAYENCRKTLQLQLSVCSLLLKRKFHLSVELCRGFGVLSISPTLRTYRIVSDESPGFNLVMSFYVECKWEQNFAADNFWNQLLELFQIGEASPYDRCLDGRTLLHELCDFYQIQPSTVELGLVIIRFANLMGSMVLEKDYYGSTCLDSLFPSDNSSVSVDDLQQVLHPFLQQGTSFRPNFRQGVRISEQILFWKQRNIEWEDAFHCNDAVKAILERSTTRLEELIQNQPETLKEYSEYISLLEWTNRIAWLEGCEMLWKHRSLLDSIVDRTWLDEMYPKPPTLSPRYSPEVLREILEEDAYLLSRLDHLVVMFDAQYDSRGEDIVDFIMGHWSEMMLSELEALERADDEQYGEGRQHLGIDLATKRDEGSNRSTLEAGLVGEVNLDTLISPFYKITIRGFVPTVRTPDEIYDIFHEVEEQTSSLTPTS